ncbi:hypothetical protein B0T22DRAFT_172636 [Podospora appendiculata]|uniref:MYND-type domain-containing protein n=1 Tax=Podospora appendiculata TaxID=314037 RepID=A0AAE1CDC6_9PEZI|nr:hypothetical protein B0T22DRAFT_172636 [Podospora appendiculata]
MATKFNDFNNAAAFPAWDLLPYDNMIDKRYDDQNGLPKRHWCFLAEIHSYSLLSFLRFRTVVNDDNGQDSIVAFYLDNYDEFDASKLQSGHTLAIVYAQQRFFLDGTYGVRVENPKHVRIFPLGLRKMQYLGYEMQKYYPGENGQKCHGCDRVAEPGETLDRCGGCRTFCYCNKACQVKAWKRERMGHKETCCVVRDPSFHALLKLDFSTYNGPHTFPK